MEKENVLKASVFGGLGLWCIPIFVKSIGWIRYISYPVMAFGIIYFIAGDRLKDKFSVPMGTENLSFNL